MLQCGLPWLTVQYSSIQPLCCSSKAFCPACLAVGLGELGYWGSWFFTHFTLLALSGVVCGLVGLYPFSHTQLVIMLLFFVLFSASLVFFRWVLPEGGSA